MCVSTSVCRSGGRQGNVAVRPEVVATPPWAGAVVSRRPTADGLDWAVDGVGVDGRWSGTGEEVATAFGGGDGSLAQAATTSTRAVTAAARTRAGQRDLIGLFDPSGRPVVARRRYASSSRIRRR